MQKTAYSHLHVQAEERVVSEEAIAAGRGHQVACEGHIAVWVFGLQQRGWPMHHLIHVAAHTVQRQIVCHLHKGVTHSRRTSSHHTLQLSCQAQLVVEPDV